MAKIKLECDTCGKEIWRHKSQISKNANYCSMACVGVSHKHGTEVQCFMCDKTFYRRFGEQDLDIKKKQFCSRSCYFSYRVENMKDSTYPKDGPTHKHRIVAESVLGRKLTPEEIVHHIDEDKHNLHPTNLAVFPNQSIHAKCHFGKMTLEEIMEYCIAKER